MKDSRGFFLCRKPHRVNEHHSRDGVTKKINILKAIHPTELLPNDDFEYIDGMFNDEGGDIGKEEGSNEE